MPSSDYQIAAGWNTRTTGTEEQASRRSGLGPALRLNRLNVLAALRLRRNFAARRGLTLVKMTEQEIEELAAILLNEHGYAALWIAEARRDQHRHKPRCDAFRLWDAITAAVVRLLSQSESSDTTAKHREHA
jgi:hypothetical protein